MSHYQWVKSHYLPINSHKRWCFNVTPPHPFLWCHWFTHRKKTPIHSAFAFTHGTPGGSLVMPFSLVIHSALRHPGRVTRKWRWRSGHVLGFGFAPQIGVVKPPRTVASFLRPQIGDGVCDWENATFRESANYKIWIKNRERSGYKPIVNQ